MSTHLAIDIGGSHGRGILGVFRDGRWQRQEIGSFSTRPGKESGQLVWDVFSIFAGIRGLTRKAAAMTDRLDTVGVDAMGLAFALLDGAGELACPPLYTRTPQGEQEKAEILAHLGRERLYGITGLEQEKLNTLYYLRQLLRMDGAGVAAARRFLMLPDLMNYWLTGVAHNEYTISTTSDLWDIQRGTWSEALIRYAGLSPEAFCPVSRAGDLVGPLKRELAELSALRDTVVVHVPSHDTAAACYTLSREEHGAAFFSIGTWGMTGCIRQTPILTAGALAAGFANEGAGKREIKFLNNAPCMSILLGCLQEWYPRGPLPWNALFDSISPEAEGVARLDLYDPRFRAGEKIATGVLEYCRDTGQTVPATRQELLLTVLDSIACHFRDKAAAMETLTGQKVRRFTMLGGATRNPVLTGLCRKRIPAALEAGDPEASGLGNLMAQREWVVKEHGEEA